MIKIIPHHDIHPYLFAEIFHMKARCEITGNAKLENGQK